MTLSTVQVEGICKGGSRVTIFYIRVFYVLCHGMSIVLKEFKSLAGYPFSISVNINSIN